MVDWDGGGGHAGLAAAASGATRRGSRAPGAPDRGSRQRRDGSQLAHSATQDGAEAKTVARRRRWVEGRKPWIGGLAGTRGRTIDPRPGLGDEQAAAAQIGDRGSLHLQPTEATHPSPSFHREPSPIHLLSPHATLLERHRDLDWELLEGTFRAGQIGALEQRIPCCSVMTIWGKNHF